MIDLRVADSDHTYLVLGVDVTKSSQNSRRNSESVLQNAMAIAAAVPQLVVQGGKISEFYFHFPE